MEVSGTFILDFHVGGLIISCGCLWWFGGSHSDIGCEWFKAHWVGSKNLEATLRIALEGPNENFDNIIEEAIHLWKIGTKYQFLYANHSCYMSSTSDVFCSITSVMFPILRMSTSFKVTYIDVLTNLWKMYAPSLDPYIFKGYILGPKMVGAWQGSTPSKDTWDFSLHKFSPLKA